MPLDRISLCVAGLPSAWARKISAHGPVATSVSFARFGAFLAAEKAVHKLPSIEHLAHMYGARLPELLKQMDNRPDLAASLGTNGDIAAQIVLAAREEMAVSLCDAVMRRTGIGQFGPPPRAVLDAASKVMAQELGWNEDRRIREIDALLPWFETREAA